MAKAHDVGLEDDENLVEDILENEEYQDRKHKSLQNMQYEMMNGLLNKNIVVANEYFDNEELENEIDYELNYSFYNKEDSGSLSRGSLSDLLREKREGERRRGKRKGKGGKKGRRSQLDTAVASILDEELERFEDGRKGD